jgi:pimeloyl-ACP methyl ester carboxylesterase
MTATQKADEFVGSFSEHFVQVNGLRIRYLEAGQGTPVVILHGNDGLTPSLLNNLLAQRFRVLAVEIPGFGRSPGNVQLPSLCDLARTLTQAAAAAGLERYVLVSTSASASLALWQALDAPERIEALVLISPTALLPADQTATGGFDRDPELEKRLGDIQAETLVLLGTNDRSMPPDTGQRYVESIPNCYYVLVYDAGRAIEAERPDALFAAVCDFVEHRGAFVVEHASTALNP